MDLKPSAPIPLIAPDMIDGFVYRALHDIEMGPLSRVNVPEVLLLEPTHRVYMTEAIQWMTYDLFTHFAPNLGDEAPARHEGLYGDHKAFCNNTGLDVFRNYVRKRRLDMELPAFDKTRCCGGAELHGTEAYSLLQAIKEIPAQFMTASRSIRKTSFAVAARSFLSALTTNNVLQVSTIDSSQPMPSLDDILLNHWHFTATIVYEKKIGDFPNGQIPSLNIWNPSVVPLISDHTKGPVTYPLSKLQKFPKGTKIDPYKIYLV